MITAALQNAIIYFRNFWLSFFFQRFCTIHSILNSLPIPHYFSFSLSLSLSLSLFRTFLFFALSHSLFSIKPSFCCAHILFHSLSDSPILYFMTLSSVIMNIGDCYEPFYSEDLHYMFPLSKILHRLKIAHNIVMYLDWLNKSLYTLYVILSYILCVKSSTCLGCTKCCTWTLPRWWDVSVRKKLCLIIAQVIMDKVSN